MGFEHRASSATPESSGVAKLVSRLVNAEQANAPQAVLLQLFGVAKLVSRLVNAEQANAPQAVLLQLLEGL